MPKVSVTGAIGDPYPYHDSSSWTGMTGSHSHTVSLPGPQGTTGAVGSMHYNYTTGNVTVNTGAGNLVTFGPQTGAANWSNNATTYNATTYDPNTLPTDVVIKRTGKPDLPIGKTLDAIMERLCIIEPALEKLEKYPALKAAYENYKLIEAMIQNDNGDNNE